MVNKIENLTTAIWASRWLSGKESACQCRRHRFDLWVGKIPWRRKWQPTPVFLPGKSHGQRRLAGYSSRGHRSVRHNLVTKTNSHLARSKLNNKTTSHSQMTQTHVFILLCLVHFMINSSLWWVCLFLFLFLFSHSWHSFSISNELSFFSLSQSPPSLYVRIKKQVLTLDFHPRWSFLDLTHSFHTASYQIPPGPDSQVSIPETGSIQRNACNSICRHCAGMRYWMTGFHLDIIYLLY